MRRNRLERFGFSVFMLMLMFTLLAGTSPAQQYPFQNPDLPLEKRLDDLVSRMTLEEKIGQMLYTAPAIERLGIPEYNWWNECLHGVGRAGLATVFPQAIGLAATWDSEFMHQVATAISDEARAKHHEFVRRGKRQIYQGLTFWTPNINIFRDPRWGRGQETYGEDPYLTGRMAVAFIKGLQGDDPNYLKLVATAKHFAVHSGPEPSRHTFDAQTSDYDLYETYLPAFEATVREAGVESIMCAYNRFRGEAACASPFLLEKTLRDDWQFDGYVVSDCWAVVDIFRYHKIVETPAEAAAISVKSGTDLNCGSTFPALTDSYEQGLIDEAALDQAVRRLFKARFKLGMFDPQDRIPWAQIPYSVNNSPEHQHLALEAARRSIVLLKNANQALPLSKDLKTLAVIGPNADDRFVMQGNYNGTAERLVTALDGIREAVSKDTELLYSPGCHIAPGVPTLVPIASQYLRPLKGDAREQGLTGSYFANSSFEGKPSLVRTDPVVNFVWRDQTPLTGIMADAFSVRWEGFVVPPVSGTYKLGVNGLTGYKLFLNDEQIVSHSDVHRPHENTSDVELSAGKLYHIRLEFTNVSSDPQAQLVWAIPQEEPIENALAIARKADAVVFVGGLSPQLEGEEMPVKVEGFEGGDRTNVALPSTQMALLQQLVETGKPVIVVLMNGSALGTVWVDENVNAVLTAWYPGQSGGTAIAEVLFGDYNPGGRLPVTYYRSVDDIPDFNSYDMEGRTYKYFRGSPLYPFGHGLSYTSFGYQNLVVSDPEVRPGQTITVSVEVSNSGSRAGDEVVQLYVSDREASFPVPIRTLEGFKRIHLAAGEKKTVAFALSPSQFALVNAEGKQVIESGEFEISVGGKQPGLTGTADAETTTTVSATVRAAETFTP
ncbi:MAG: glycoside hydrolase family 3 C-terminal domain-containing protein [Acidobacteriota bacterium]|nr:MAG: glycoside hydrolase family 3 C-terminal domain-containing protein [Acidobacteriota bacterium]